MDRNKIASSLKRKGFDEDNSGDHRFFHHKFNGKVTGVRTKLSRGSKHRRIGAPLLSSIRKQLKLDTQKELSDLVNCPMTKEHSAEILKTKNIL